MILCLAKTSSATASSGLIALASRKMSLRTKGSNSGMNGSDALSSGLKSGLGMTLFMRAVRRVDMSSGEANLAACSSMSAMSCKLSKELA